MREGADLGVPAGTAVSPREGEVLDLLGQGLSDPAIGERLGISSVTVRDTPAALVDKLQAETMATSSVSSVMRDTTPRSILSAWTGKRRSCNSDE